jgi:ABC-type Fe3+/spermidine/putrescine transport system ATPase subunit
VGEHDVELRGVTRILGGRRVVDGVTLSIRRGEFFSLLGPSGCGKTTLLRMISGFDAPDEGEVLLGGKETRGVPPHRRDVNLVFQNYALFPHLSVGENVAFGPKLRGRPGIPDLVAKALQRVRLASYEERRPATLSGGEQQRVALARAIVNGPRVLLLDEPLGALDRKLRKGLQEELRRLHRELGMTFLYVTHDQEEALSMSDRIAVMRNGRIEQVGTPVEIYDRPENRFVAEFVGTANLFEGDADGNVLRTADGWEFPCAATGPAAALLRPEQLRFGPEGRSATVEETLYLGATTRVLLRAGDRTLVAENDDIDVRPGAEVRVSFAPGDSRILPR